MLKKLRTRLTRLAAPLLLLLWIVLVGGYLRFLNLNWDQGQYLHPDERFLTMVMTAMEVPANFKVYLDPYNSTFNPANVGYKFYVYGNFPLTFTKLLAIPLDMDDYGSLGQLGRKLSATFETVMMGLVFLVAWQLQKRFGWRREVKFAASFFYAITTFSIQQAHFFTADSFGVFFAILALLVVLQLPKFRLLAGLVAGSLLGLSLASKVNFILFVPVVYWFLIGVKWEEFKKWKAFGMLAGRTVVLSALFIFSLLFFVKIGSPYYFNSLAIYDLRPNELFLSNIAQLKSFSDPNALFPPSVQWISKPKIIFPLINIIFVGLGPPLFVLVGIGLVFELAYGFGGIKKSLDRLVIPLWILAFFLFQGAQFVTTMRYFYILYPLMAIFAGVGLMQIVGRVYRLVHDSKTRRVVVSTFLLLVIVSCMIWPFAFVSIYLQRHSRVEASYWMYENLPDDSTIGSEAWDDGLPVSLEPQEVGSKKFNSIQLNVFYPDNEDKWAQLDHDLGQIDYYVLSSNRAWASITSVPDRYPEMSQFYQDLFAGNTDFQLIAEFNSYPSLEYLGIPVTFPDQWAEEAFTVYDHPVVYVFERNKTK